MSAPSFTVSSIKCLPGCVCCALCAAVRLEKAFLNLLTGVMVQPVPSAALFVLPVTRQIELVPVQVPGRRSQGLVLVQEEPPVM
jgi:hypothetical protein